MNSDRDFLLDIVELIGTINRYRPDTVGDCVGAAGPRALDAGCGVVQVGERVAAIRRFGSEMASV